MNVHVFVVGKVVVSVDVVIAVAFCKFDWFYNIEVRKKDKMNDGQEHF